MGNLSERVAVVTGSVGGAPGDSDVIHMDIDVWDLAMTVNLRG